MADYEAVTGPSAIARSPVEFDDTPVPVEQPIGNPMLQGRSMMARTALDLTPSVQDGPSPVQSMMPLPDAPPAHMIAAVQMDPVTGMPTPTPGARILQMPTIAQSTMPEYIYKVDPNSAEMRPWLPDMTGNSIDLSGNRNMASRQLIAVERYPTLPFWPGTYNRRAIQRQMSDIELFIRSWKPKQIPPFALTSSASWQQMPHPAPVFVLIPHFGTSVALYYRWG